ncbi:hypothetical protein DPMN_047613 [Dreissena polymorpha]|uniref:Uncharacterized protein n=1 Tax=Dreissena polymorpha TaxID=45954 RepID=A0A9D4D816_DREPO|nr:hypothetical protein DPMN_047613 [Dreissena polymorpha]
MPQEHENKRKERNSSGTSGEVSVKTKQCKDRGPSDEMNIPVSDILYMANVVLYNDDADSNNVDTECVFLSGITSTSQISKTNTTTQAADREPTIKIILDSNKGIMASILALKERLSKIEAKLGTIDRLDKKVS